MKKLGVFGLIICLFMGTLNPISVSAYDQNIVIDGNVVLQEFDGWGTSLCWWANAIGQWNDQQKKETIMDLLFSKEEGLGLNIVRYNIGGGENPDHEHMRDKAEMDSFQPEEGQWNWNADASQRWVLLEAIDRGVDVTEAFVNSPPYWMTYSGCAAGSVTRLNNLKSDYYDDFVHYVTSVLKFYEDEYGVSFDTVAPFNEPVALHWVKYNNQEGCRFDVDSQKEIINLLTDEMEKQGVNHTVISASEEYNLNDTLGTYRGYGEQVQDHVQQINTHTYKGDQRVALGLAAKAHNKDIWVSEVGCGGSASHDHNDMTSALELSNLITKDIKELQADAWVYWQAVEDEAGQNNWGFIHSNFSGDEEYFITKQYYSMMQYTKFIRPGSLILGHDDEGSIVSYNPREGQLVIVSTNNSDQSVEKLYSFEGISTVNASATIYRTKHDENFQKISESIEVNNGLTYELAPESITTIVIDGVSLEGETDFDRNNYYVIENVNSGFVMDVNNESKDNGASMIQWEYTGRDNQLWKMVQDRDGYYYIVNKGSGMVLDVNRQSTDNGEGVIQYDGNAGDNQKWSFELLAGDTFKIVNKNSSKLLDVEEESLEMGASIIQWEDHSGPNQQWLIIEADAYNQ